eukprot:Blabericola_migrator_1__3598@NODE_2072_length_3324_cov_139_459625_g1312_i0_p1_GENE_NODE_2072_length_3324_cov_139_459625_g1312_i0NODE_2072_length_3324_cov_139_459625_g1312_i0_p1_ORF_typecomplete_len292_score52_93PP2/PF14299_6/0_013Fboxlike/PF12937_7/0_1Fboxlike/PF12937_7/9_7e03_NODE_2072_length_3324_cov_139_459625_g1312_i023593234
MSLLTQILQIPNVSLALLSLLHISDFRSLSLTCKAISKIFKDTSDIWRVLLERRHGVTETSRGWRQEFIIRSQLRRSAVHYLQGVWSRDTHYWKPTRLPDTRSIMYLDYVWWLETAVVFTNVVPGLYKIRWSVIGHRKKIPFFVSTSRYPLKQQLSQQEIEKRHREFGPGETNRDDLSLVRVTHFTVTQDEIFEFPLVVCITQTDDIVTGVCDASPTIKSGWGLEWVELVPVSEAPRGYEVMKQGDPLANQDPAKWQFKYFENVVFMKPTTSYSLGLHRVTDTEEFSESYC